MATTETLISIEAALRGSSQVELMAAEALKRVVEHRNGQRIEKPMPEGRLSERGRQNIIRARRLRAKREREARAKGPGKKTVVPMHEMPRGKKAAA